MCLIDDDQIPFDRWKTPHQFGGIIICRQGNAGFFSFFKPRLPVIQITFNGQPVQNAGLDAELLLQFDFPLFAQRCRYGDQNMPSS